MLVLFYDTHKLGPDNVCVCVYLFICSYIRAVK